MFCLKVLTPEELVRRMRNTAILLLVTSTVLLVGISVGISQGRPLRPSDAPWIVIALGLVIGSISLLRPGGLERMRQQYAAFRSPEGFGKAMRRGRWGLLLASASLALEIPLAVFVWPLQEWQPWIAAVLGTTILFIIVCAVVLKTAPRFLPDSGNERGGTE